MPKYLIQIWISMLLFAANMLGAFEIGEPEIQSQLNTNLEIEIPVILDLNESIDDIVFQLSGIETYQLYGIQRPQFIDELNLSVIKKELSEDSIFIQIQSNQPISRSSFLLLMESGNNSKVEVKAFPVVLIAPNISRDYAIQKGDTLWGIAFKNRPGDDLTMDQVMIALYQTNFHIFKESINDIKEGVIRIPTREYISRISPLEIFNEAQLKNDQVVDGNEITEIQNESNQYSDIDISISTEPVSMNDDPEIIGNKDDNLEIESNIKVPKENDSYVNPVNKEIQIQNELVTKLSDPVSIIDDPIDPDVKTKSSEVRVINHNKSIEFNNIIRFIDEFWALLILSAVLLLSVLLLIWNKYNKERKMVINLEQSIAMNEVATKLDLARAYVDMGDPDGAFEILEEVVVNGDQSQRQLAKKLLKSLNR